MAPMPSSRILKIGVICVLVSICLIVLVPLAVKFYLGSWLEKNGADTATIESLRLNPFLGKVRLQGVNVTAAEQVALLNSEMQIDVGLQSLFRKNIVIQEASYQGLKLDVQQYDDGHWRIGSYTLPSTAESTKDPAEEGENEWQFAAEHILLEKCEFTLETPEVEAVLIVDRAELLNLSSLPGAPPATFTFQGSLNNSPLTITLSRLRVAPHVELEGELGLQEFLLAGVAGLVKETLPTLAGQISANGKMSLDVKDASGVDFDYRGSLIFSDGELGSEDFLVSSTELSWTGNIGAQVPDGLPFVLQAKGELLAQENRFAQPEAELEGNWQELLLNGEAQVEVSTQVSARHNGKLEIGGLQLEVAGNTLVQEATRWQGVVEYTGETAGEDMRVQTEGKLGMMGSTYTSPTMTMDALSLVWQGQAGYGQKAEQAPQLTLDGTLGAEKTSTVDHDISRKASVDKLQLQGDMVVQISDAPEVSAQAAGTAGNFKIVDQSTAESLLNIGNIVIDGATAGRENTLTVGRIEVADSSGAINGGLPLIFTGELFEVEGVMADDWQNFKVELVRLSDVLLRSQINDNELLQLGALTLRGSGLDTALGAVSVATIGLKDLTFLTQSGDQPFVKFDEAELTAGAYHPDRGVSGETLIITTLAADLQRDKDGTFLFTQHLEEMQTYNNGSEGQDTNSAPENKEVKDKLDYRLGSVSLTGDSTITFSDRTMSMPFKVTAEIEKMRVGPLDSSRPELETILSLNAKIDQRAILEANGVLSPLLPQPQSDVQVELKNYPLTSLSPYTVEAVGVALAGGQLQLQSDFKLAENRLDMANDVLLKKLETETISAELAAELDNQLPLPLDSALAMLRDNEDNISLAIPLQGSLDELDVGISDIVITALGKAIVPAASGYLMYALGPYGALAYVGMKVGEKLLEVNLPPVQFDPGGTLLTEEHRQYLERVGQILNDRPETDLQICPRVASWEFLEKEQLEKYDESTYETSDQERTDLLALGEERGKTVQQHLAQEYGVDKNRLLICQTEVVAERSTQPAVLLFL